MAGGAFPSPPGSEPTRWKTSLFPKDGGYIVPIKEAVRHAERIELGDVVELRLTTPPR